jgi:undecaprenyl-diphosphatase
MTLGIAALLGLVQGLFMFLPVSSTAHLVLTQHWLLNRGADIPAPHSAEMILFDLIVHVGTLVSVVIIFRRSLLRFTRDSLRDARALLHRPGPLPLSLRLGLLLLLSVLVTGVLGLLFKTSLEALFARPWLVATSMIITGGLLWLTDRLPRRTRGLRAITPTMAIGIGAVQALALAPGISRSGITIVTALLFGLKRRWAAEYSFFLAIPTILAATLLQALELHGLDAPTRIPLTALALAFVVSAVVGTGALWLVVRLLLRARLRIFSWYLWLLAGLILTGTPMAGH